jgi:flagellar hook-length control protein FliK
VPAAAVASAVPTPPAQAAPVEPDAAQAVPVPVDPTATAATPADAPAGVPVPTAQPGTESPPADVPATVTAEVPADATRTPDVPADPSATATATPDATPQGAVQADAGRTGDEPAAEESSSSAAAPAADAPAAPPAAAPIAPTVQAVLAGTQRTAALHQAPRAVAQLIHVASRDGIDHARINLRPADLGGIEIRLRHSAAGVAAHVIAESPEAARLLDQAAGDLRRALERQDVTLLSLDVSTSQDQRADGSSGSAFDLGGDRERRHDGGRQSGGRSETEAEAVVSHTVRLPDGLLVDVLA